MEPKNIDLFLLENPKIFPESKKILVRKKLTGLSDYDAYPCHAPET